MNMKYTTETTTTKTVYEKESMTNVRLYVICQLNIGRFMKVKKAALGDHCKRIAEVAIK